MTARRDAARGAFLGLTLPLLATAVEATALSGSGGLGFRRALLESQRNPVIWLLWLAPLVLAAFGLLAGRRHDALLAVERAHREELRRTMAGLSGAAEALLEAVASFSAMVAGTTAAVRETTATMGQLGQTATHTALAAETVVHLAERSRRAVEAGGAAATGLVGELSRVSEAARQITAVAEQQDRGVEQALQALNEIFLAAERSADATEQVAAQARRLTDIAEQLKRQLERTS